MIPAQANASLLDEATAAAEAMSMCVALSKNGKKKAAMTFFADAQCHPQTIAVVKTRCEALGIEVVVGDATTDDLGDACIGVLWQYPNTRGDVVGDAAGVSARAHDAGALSVVAADPLALTLLPAPGTFGADICVGSMQRYGVPMGFAGFVKAAVPFAIAQLILATLYVLTLGLLPVWWVLLILGLIVLAVKARGGAADDGEEGDGDSA